MVFSLAEPDSADETLIAPTLTVSVGACAVTSGMRSPIFEETARRCGRLALSNALDCGSDFEPTQASPAGCAHCYRQLESSSIPLPGRLFDSQQGWKRRFSVSYLIPEVSRLLG